MFYIGYIIYFTYGIRHSTEGALKLKEVQDKANLADFEKINHISLKHSTKL